MTHDTRSQECSSLSKTYMACGGEDVTRAGYRITAALFEIAAAIHRLAASVESDTHQDHHPDH